MPDLQLNYAETPPWLKNDAVESNFLRDVEAGQRINAQRQQLPLKLKAMQQDAQMNELKIGETIRQRDDLLQAEREAQGLGDTIAPYLDQQQPDKALSALLAAGVRKPILFKSPQWQTMVKEVQAAVTAQRAQKQLETLEGLRKSQEEENHATAIWRKALAEGGTAGGKPTAFDINSRLYAEAKAAVIAADNARQEAQTPEERTKAEADYQNALATFNARERFAPAAGSEFNKQTIETRLAQRTKSLDVADTRLELEMKEKGFVVQHNANGTKTLVPVARPMTTGALTQSQESSASAMESLAALDEAIAVTTAHPEAFGIQGKAQRLAEQAKGQLNPNTPMETPIADTQQKASIAFAKVARSLRPDTGNMSRYELSKLEQAGDVLGFEVSPQEALTKQKNLRAAVLGGELRRLEARHAEPDADLLRRIPFEELAGLLAGGLLTKAQAERWYQVNRPK